MVRQASLETPGGGLREPSGIDLKKPLMEAARDLEPIPNPKKGRQYAQRRPSS